MFCYQTLVNILETIYWELFTRLWKNELFNPSANLVSYICQLLDVVYEIDNNPAEGVKGVSLDTFFCDKNNVYNQAG